ncbi:IS5 family transposase, partial [Acaryochloris marina NIES-2412]|uniref:IS5 family transposase n=1 Tax=Acaryochloris marina TaxID=155978 RepID=UPI00405832AD
WSEYNAGLKQRGSVTFWLEQSAMEHWLETTPSHKRGASLTYSDIAISTFETLKCIYGLAGRQTEGFLSSLFELMGIELPVCDHSTVSRRKGQLSISLPVVPKQGALHVVIDSTGVKVYGEGEWKTRQHGVSKRRTWRKLHLSVDESTGEILTGIVTTNDVQDGEVFEDLLDG